MEAPLFIGKAFERLDRDSTIDPLPPPHPHSMSNLELIISINHKIIKVGGKFATYEGV